jgi:hypothetical protein
MLGASPLIPRGEHCPIAKHTIRQGDWCVVEHYDVRAGWCDGVSNRCRERQPAFLIVAVNKNIVAVNKNSDVDIGQRPCLAASMGAV